MISKCTSSLMMLVMELRNGIRRDLMKETEAALKSYKNISPCSLALLDKDTRSFVVAS